jgi:hypothetical protein
MYNEMPVFKLTELIDTDFHHNGNGVSLDWLIIDIETNTVFRSSGQAE